MSLKKNILRIFVGDNLIFATSILTGIIVARNLGPQLFGLWAIIQIFINRRQF